MARPKGAKDIPWREIVAKLRQHPNRWLLLPELAHVSGRTIDVIRRRERHALRLDDGVIRCRRKAALVHEDGSVVVTLAVKFSPKKPKEDHDV